MKITKQQLKLKRNVHNIQRRVLNFLFNFLDSLFAGLTMIYQDYDHRQNMSSFFEEIIAHFEAKKAARITFSQFKSVYEEINAKREKKRKHTSKFLGIRFKSSQKFCQLLRLFTFLNKDVSMVTFSNSDIDEKVFCELADSGWRLSMLRFQMCNFTDSFADLLSLMRTEILITLIIKQDRIGNKGLKKILALPFSSLNTLKISLVQITNDAVKVLDKKTSGYIEMSIKGSKLLNIPLVFKITCLLLNKQKYQYHYHLIFESKQEQFIYLAFLSKTKIAELSIYLQIWSHLQKNMIPKKTATTLNQVFKNKLLQ